MVSCLTASRSAWHEESNRALSGEYSAHSTSTRQLRSIAIPTVWFICTAWLEAQFSTASVVLFAKRPLSLPHGVQPQRRSCSNVITRSLPCRSHDKIALKVSFVQLFSSAPHLPRTLRNSTSPAPPHLPTVANSLYSRTTAITATTADINSFHFHNHEKPSPCSAAPGA
jgi:hypothetical protein